MKIGSNRQIVLAIVGLLLWGLVGVFSSKTIVEDRDVGWIVFASLVIGYTICSVFVVLFYRQFSLVNISSLVVSVVLMSMYHALGDPKWWLAVLVVYMVVSYPIFATKQKLLIFGLKQQYSSS
jgi:hypothetical membrane protein